MGRDWVYGVMERDHDAVDIGGGRAEECGGLGVRSKGVEVARSNLVVGFGNAAGVVDWRGSHASELRETLGATGGDAGRDDVDDCLLMFGVEDGFWGADVADDKERSLMDNGRDGVPVEQATFSKSDAIPGDGDRE